MQKRKLTLRQELMLQQERAYLHLKRPIPLAFQRAKAEAFGQTQPKRRPVVNYQTAMRQLVDKPFLQTVKYREQQGRADRTRQLVYFDEKTQRYPILAFEKALIRDLRRRGIPMFAHCVVRSDAEQTALYVKGRTKARAGESPHNHGMAVDIIHSVLAWGLDKKSWEIISHIGYEVGARLGLEMKWGGEWSFYDPAHWELTHWRVLAARQERDRAGQGK